MSTQRKSVHQEGGFVVFNLTEFNLDGCGWWNNIAGWTVLSHAEIYAGSHMIKTLPMGGQLMSTTQAQALEEAWERSHLLETKEPCNQPTVPLFRRFMTASDAWALAILAGDQLNLKPNHVDAAMQVLQQGPSSIHPIIGNAMCREAARINDQVRNAGLLDRGNEIIEDLRKSHLLVIKRSPRIIFSDAHFTVTLTDHCVSIAKQQGATFDIPVSNPWFDQVMNITTTQSIEILYDALCTM